MRVTAAASRGWEHCRRDHGGSKATLTVAPMSASHGTHCSVRWRLELVDLIAERIQMLGGVSLAMAPDVAETTLIPRPPKGREAAPMQIARLLHAHEIVLEEARAMARRAADAGDDGTNDLLTHPQEQRTLDADVRRLP